MRLLRTVPALAAVIAIGTAMTACSGSSGPSDSKATFPALPGPARSSASAPANGRTTATYTPRSAPGDEALRHTADLLRTRAGAIGLKDARIEVRGSTITAEAPGDSGDRLRQLAVTADLGFRAVLGTDAAVTPDLQRQFTALDCKVPGSAPVPSPERPTVACDKKGPVKYALGPAALTGRDVTSAKASLDPQTGNGWTVNLVLTSAGGMKFAQLTGALAQQSPPANQIGIMLDRDVLSAPSVSQSITGGNVQISGGFTRTSAQDLAALISSGALPVALDVTEITRIPS